MAAPSKADRFNTDVARLAQWAKALSHPARIEILKVLARKSNCICGEIVDELPLAQATVSQHLKVLRSAGLIEGEIDGVRSCYWVNKEALREAQTAIADLLRGVEQTADCC